MDEDRFFVMVYSQDGNMVFPLLDNNGDVTLWDSEEQATFSAEKNPFAEAFGFTVHRVGGDEEL